MSVPLHIGLEHPNLIWIVATAIISFAVGTGFGAFKLQPKLQDDTEPNSETINN
ncbi:hypothetical protein [Halomicrobium mukohataei]|uniref:hypothetical protein n=1 Tax=Halomicrobium mukohataei TaxID=57705 RepID=UPI0014755B69|nr:hypothetical protein [Halomicrobium mukohataei]